MFCLLFWVQHAPYLLLNCLRNSKQLLPLKPSDATALVTEGMYRYSRNPMYLGLLLWTIASTIWFGTWLGIIMNIIFIFLINFLQIIPEEEALLEIFGEEYEEYKKNVRRWI